MSSIDVLLRDFHANPPADDLTLQVLADRGIRLPEDYRRFLLSHNGGDGFVGQSYVILWRAEELQELNEAYEAPRWVPGLLLFGSDGGGEAFAFDMRHEAEVLSVPFVGMDRRYGQRLASTFTEFLVALGRP